MRKITALGAMFLLLGACATGPSAFGPASGSSGLGFETTQIERDRFRVAYTARSPEEAQDFALLRSAHVARENGYSHFRVMHGAMDGNGPRSPVSTSIGFGTGGYNGNSYSSFGLGVDVLDVVRALEGDKVTNMLEIRLLSQGSYASDVYSAQDIIDNIRPEVFAEEPLQ